MWRRREPIVVRDDVDAILKALFDIRGLLHDLVRGEEENDDEEEA